VDAVNDWASEHTDGLITDIIDSFDPRTVAAIANEIYYSDRWNWEFNEDETKSDVFHAAAGDTTALYMKREGDSQLYYEDGRVQAMPLSFKNGGNLWVILPKDETANELYASMTAEYRVEIMGGCISSTGKLLLPKYEIASARAIDLKGALTALGVPLFDIEAAPLTDGLLESDTPAWIDTAMHKAVIKVDEKGTTAAAVTAMMVGGRGIPQPTGVFEMICDHPFVFVLEYGQILFTGVVNDPSETP
jgi:serpin B